MGILDAAQDVKVGNTNRGLPDPSAFTIPPSILQKDSKPLDSTFLEQSVADCATHLQSNKRELQVFVLESRFELLGHVAIVFGFPHDLADQPLLAVQVIVVEFLIEVLEHGDPLDDVQTVVVISVIGRSILGLLRVVIGALLVINLAVVVVTVGSQEATRIDQVSNNSEKDYGSQEGEGSGGA